MERSLKFWRIERQISQIALAIETGIPRHRIQLAEQTLLTLREHEIEKIASILGVSKKLIQNVEAKNGDQGK